MQNRNLSFFLWCLVQSQGKHTLDEVFSELKYFYQTCEKCLWIRQNYLFESAKIKSKLWCPLKPEEKCHFPHAILSLTF